MLSLANLSVADAGPLELLDAAAAAGFDAVNMWLVPPPGTALFGVKPIRTTPVIGDAGTIRDIKLRVATTGVHVLHASCGWVGPDFDPAGMRRAFETMGEIGARAVSVVGWDADRDRLVANLRVLCEAAEPYGFRLTIEFMPYSAVRTVGDAAAVLAAVDCPNLDVMVDALHLARSGGVPADIAAVAPERITLFQICDAPRASPPPAQLRDESVNRRRYPGEGELPLREMLAALPPGVAIEAEIPTAGHAGLPIVERARRCAETTKRFLSFTSRSDFVR